MRFHAIGKATKYHTGAQGRRPRYSRGHGPKVEQPEMKLQAVLKRPAYFDRMRKQQEQRSMFRRAVDGLLRAVRHGWQNRGEAA